MVRQVDDEAVEASHANPAIAMDLARWEATP
jgi:hypothetical protein